MRGASGPRPVGSISSPTRDDPDPAGGPDDSGLASVAAAGMVIVLVVLLGLVLALGSVAAARHRAEVAADLAALAGAAEGVRGREAGCARAAAVAAHATGRLVECSWSGWTLTVAVAAPCECPRRGRSDPIGRARAGPARGDDDPFAAGR